jgi:HD-GYP domain-containing protein (c-di-GMP phosphodiesterase class II)
MALMRRRFAEALRRAEIITLVNAAESESSLAEIVCAELAEVYDAEIAFLLDWPPKETPKVIGSIGLVGTQAAQVAASALVERAAASGGALAFGETLLAGIQAESALVAGYRGRHGRGAIAGVARLYDQRFDDAERALLEAVTASVGHGLERLWSESDRARLNEELRATSLATAAALANAMEARDNYTAGHAQIIADLAVGLGRRIGMGTLALDDLRYAAILHDIGKIAVPDEILRKPGPLTPEERAVMERHVVEGERILAPVPFLTEVGTLVRHHHERWDGDGYPDGLRGEEVPLGSRVIAIADAWHAMTSTRPYRRAISHDDARSELERSAGAQFDPKLVIEFLAYVESDGVA